MSMFKKYASSKALAKDLLDIPMPERRYQNGDFMIVVGDRGWVFVGFVTDVGNGEVRIDSCYNIHRWGTAAGLGELCTKGPLKETILNHVGVVYCKPILMMAAEIEVW